MLRNKAGKDWNELFSKSLLTHIWIMPLSMWWWGWWGNVAGFLLATSGKRYSIKFPNWAITGVIIWKTSGCLSTLLTKKAPASKSDTFEKLEIQSASESHSQNLVASSPIFVPRHAKLQEPDEGAKPSNPGRHQTGCIFSIGHSMEPKNIQSSENGARKILPNLESTWQPGVGFPTTWSSPCLHDGLQKPNRKMPSNYGWTTKYQLLHSCLHATQVKLGPPKDHRADTILVGAREFSEYHASNLFSRLIHDAETHILTKNPASPRGRTRLTVSKACNLAIHCEAANTRLAGEFPCASNGKTTQQAAQATCCWLPRSDWASADLNKNSCFTILCKWINPKFQSAASNAEARQQTHHLSLGTLWVSQVFPKASWNALPARQRFQVDVK